MLGFGLSLWSAAQMVAAKPAPQIALVAPGANAAWVSPDGKMLLVIAKGAADA
ncbi:hypothetical protein XINFAN_02893 [Pseudogemmobacter humi]|uniref:Uncharacterized protein n=1 Tax=Pseudogemmobacter humi TaxID=2483812 RepID=A0A3P5XIN4_9RHOB|nr:hypothetical protein XINFAN_02893 [Pseudogemmobacter humi]